MKKINAISTNETNIFWPKYKKSDVQNYSSGCEGELEIL